MKNNRLSQGKTTRREFLKSAGRAGVLVTLAGSLPTVFPEMGTAAEARKICLFSKHLQWLDYEDMARTAADIGFDGMDLTVRPGGHVLPENVERDLPLAVNAMKKAGLEPLMMTTAVADPDDPVTETILRVASRQGIKYYRTNWLDYQEGMSIQENLDAYTRQLTGLAALNRKYGIRGGYQNHMGDGVGAAVWDLWMILKQVDSPWMGSQYDIRHATVEGTDTWPLGLRLLSPYINTLVLKDFHWIEVNGKSQIENVPLDQGMVEFDRYIPMLQELQVDAPVTLHFEYDLGGAERGAERLSVDPDVVISAMKRDLATARKMLA